MPGTPAKPNTPIRNTSTTDAVALVASSPNKARVTVSPARARTSARSRSWSAARPPVGSRGGAPPADQVPDDQADAVHHEQPGDGRRGEAAYLGERVGDIA